MDDIKDKLKDIDDKLEEHSKLLASVDKTLAIQALQLETHIKRTDVAEANLELLRQDFKPVQGHVQFINNLSKAITILGTVVGIVYGIMQILGLSI